METLKALIALILLAAIFLIVATAFFSVDEYIDSWGEHPFDQLLKTVGLKKDKMGYYCDEGQKPPSGGVCISHEN